MSDSPDPSGSKTQNPPPHQSWRLQGVFPAIATFLVGPSHNRERVGALPWIKRLLFGWILPKDSDDGLSKSSALKNDTGQTDPLLARLVKLGIFMLTVIFVYGLSLGNPAADAGTDYSDASQFIMWGFVGAMAASLFGLALGMLFGLPTTRGWSSRRAVAATNSSPANPVNPEPSGGGNLDGLQTCPQTTASTEVGRPSILVSASGSLADQDIPYDENTSLEQIADWLTKIIVGLTLVQFVTWRSYFESTAQLLSSLMYKNNPPVMQTAVSRAQLDKLAEAITGTKLDPTNLSNVQLVAETANPLAGGLVMASFGLLGFLMAYLWMRRYFIPEMVIARRNAVELANIRRQNAVEIEMSQNKTKMLELQRELDEERLKAKMAEEKRLSETALETARKQSAIVQQRVPFSPTIDSITAAAKAAIVGNLSNTEAVETAISKIANPELGVTNDPWASRFGQSSSNRGYTLSGEVKAIDRNPDWFLVELKVQATETATISESAGRIRAIFFFPPNCKPESQLVAFGSDANAPLNILAYGAFTVGVLLDDGTTMLELNLASLPGAQQFKIFLAI